MAAFQRRIQFFCGFHCRKRRARKQERNVSAVQVGESCSRFIKVFSLFWYLHVCCRYIGAAMFLTWTDIDWPFGN